MVLPTTPPLSSHIECKDNKNNLITQILQGIFLGFPVTLAYFYAKK
jgi:hypothetical protein